MASGVAGRRELQLEGAFPLGWREGRRLRPGGLVPVVTSGFLAGFYHGCGKQGLVIVFFDIKVLGPNVLFENQYIYMYVCMYVCICIYIHLVYTYNF